MTDVRHDISPTAESHRLGFSATLIVLLYAGLLLIPFLGGSFRVLTLHEVFAAEPAREMLSDGAWIIPQFAGVPRLVKPPATGWLIAGSMKLFGTEAEWAVRLPVALCGVLTAWMVASLAARWLGRTAGLVAGLCQASFVYMLMQARLSEADIPMCAAVVLAMLAFARGAVDRPAGRFAIGWILLFHLGSGLAVVTKGVGLAFIFAGCVAWVVITRRWRTLWFLFHPLGLLVLVAVAGAWPLLAYQQYPPILSIWWRETLGRAGGGFQDGDPFYIYVWAVPFLLLPWLPFVMRGLVESFRGRGGRFGWLKSRAGIGHFFQFLRQHPRAAFLLTWFSAGMIILTISAARHKHYAIPMLPPATLLASAGLIVWLKDSNTAFASRQRRIGTIAVAAGIAAASSSGLMKTTSLTATLWPAALLVVAVILLGVGATLSAHAANRSRPTLVALFGTVLVAALTTQAFILPRFDDYRATADLARRANLLVPAGVPVHLVELREHPVAFYLRRPFDRADRIDRRENKRTEPSDVERLLERSISEELYVLCPQKAAEKLSAFGQVTPLDRVDHRRRHETDSVVLLKLTRTAAHDHSPTTRPAEPTVPGI